MKNRLVENCIEDLEFLVCLRITSSLQYNPLLSPFSPFHFLPSFTRSAFSFSTFTFLSVLNPPHLPPHPSSFFPAHSFLSSSTHHSPTFLTPSPMHHIQPPSHPFTTFHLSATTHHLYHPTPHMFFPQSSSSSVFP